MKQTLGSEHRGLDKDLSLAFFFKFLLLFQGHLSDHVILNRGIQLSHTKTNCSIALLTVSKYDKVFRFNLMIHPGHPQLEIVYSGQREVCQCPATSHSHPCGPDTAEPGRGQSRAPQFWHRHYINLHNIWSCQLAPFPCLLLKVLRIYVNQIKSFLREGFADKCSDLFQCSYSI